MPGNLDNVSTVQLQIVSVAQRTPKIAYTSLATYMTLEWLESAYHETRMNGATGIDDVSGSGMQKKSTLVFTLDIDSTLHSE